MESEQSSTLATGSGSGSVSNASGDASTGGNDIMADSHHHPVPDMNNESILLTTADLAQMLLISPGSSEDQEGEEGSVDEEEGEERDLVMDLDSRFRSADDVKRKFAEALSGGGPNGSFANRNSASGGSRGGAGGSGGGGGGDAGGVVTWPAGATAIPVPKHVKTVVRVRPIEAGAGERSLEVKDALTVMTSNPFPTSRGGSQLYTYARVMGESTKQAEVYEETAKPIVAGMFDKPARSGLCFAYGNTNAGKSHTIMGPRNNEGILPRTLADVYRRVQETTDGTQCVNLRVVEVYRNKAYDLLRAKDERGAALAFKQTPKGDEIEGLSEHYPADLAAALELVKQGRNRAPVAKTALNATSSRAHTVWMVEVQQRLEGGGGVRVGVSTGGGGAGGGRSRPSSRRGAPRGPVLWVVDLAGSERIDRSMSNRGEAMSINRDISSLFTCFKQLEAGNQHVSCRDRTATRLLLKNMLLREADDSSGARNRFGWGGGNGGGGSSSSPAPRLSCVMIINVNPAASEYGETEKVLTNALISTKARLLEKPPQQVCSVGSALYGMNGHRIKRQKASHHAPRSDSPASWAPDANKAEETNLEGSQGGSQRGSRGGSLGCGEVVVSRDERSSLGGSEAQAREIVRLESEKAKLQEELEMIQEVAWIEAQEELLPQIEDLEITLARERENTRDLRAQLLRQEPAGAAAKAVVAESTRKKAAKQVMLFCEQGGENVREAEEELLREQEQRTRAEEALRVAIAEREAVAAQAALLAAEESTLRRELEESRAEAVRLREENVGLVAALAAETTRASGVEAENAGLRDEMRAAMEQNELLHDTLAYADAEVSTVRMDESAVSDSSDAAEGDEPRQREPSFAESGAVGVGERGSASSKNEVTAAVTTAASRVTRQTRATTATRSSSSAKRRGRVKSGKETPTPLPQSQQSVDGDDGDDHAGGIAVSPERDPGAAEVGGGDKGNRCDGATVSGCRLEREQDAGAKNSLSQSPGTLPLPSSPSSGSSSGGGGGGSLGRDEEGDSRIVNPDSEAETGAEEPVETRGGRTKRTTRLTLRARKPLGNLEGPTGVVGNARNRGPTEAEAAAAGGKGRGKRSNDAGNEKSPPLLGTDEYLVVEEGESPRARKKREKMEKAEQEKQEKREKAAEVREETRRCRAAREEAMMSKPEPVVVALSKKQVDIAEKAKAIIRARRSGRRRN